MLFRLSQDRSGRGRSMSLPLSPGTPSVGAQRRVTSRRVHSQFLLVVNRDLMNPGCTGGEHAGFNGPGLEW